MKRVRISGTVFFHKIRRASVWILMIALLAGCRHTRKTAATSTATLPVPTPAPAVTTPSKADAKATQALKTLASGQLEFREMSAKVKTKIASPQLNQSFTTNIRWKKGEKIWMSMSIIGIEGARVLITRDSIKIMDKINSRYILKPISYIREKLYMDLTYDDLEKLLLAQPVLTDAAIVKYADNTENTRLTSDGPQYLTTLTMNKVWTQLLTNFVSDKKNNRTFYAAYSDWQPQGGKTFPMHIQCKAQTGKDIVDLDLAFQSIEFKTGMEYPFSINNKYKIE